MTKGYRRNARLSRYLFTMEIWLLSTCLISVFVSLPLWRDTLNSLWSLKGFSTVECRYTSFSQAKFVSVSCVRYFIIIFIVELKPHPHWSFTIFLCRHLETWQTRLSALCLFCCEPRHSYTPNMERFKFTWTSPIFFWLVLAANSLFSSTSYLSLHIQKSGNV